MITDEYKETKTYKELTTDLLFKVTKPAQYLGMEWGKLINNPLSKSGIKTWENTKVHSAIVYPDLYELGLANFGIKILYKILNYHPDFLCDRSYAPMKDMEKVLRENDLSLWGWETYKPLKDFDLLGFSLSYELAYTNVLNLLELSKLNLKSVDRKEHFPLIFAGGPATFNPEPMADFIDFFIIGDGEEVLIEIHEFIKLWKKENKDKTHSKDDLLIALANIQGLYVPKFYTPDPNDNYLPKANRNDVPEKIIKRVVSFGDYNHPAGELVPYLSTVHDRQVLEIRRGCDRGCRFCQPGYVYLPVRERTPENLLQISKDALKATGYDEYSLLSLSASDYTKLHEVATRLNDEHSEKGISLSMPSQRADRFDMTIANEINAVRKTGITLAPEAGTERMRAVINKGLKESDIKKAIENVYDAGYKSVKLYFMIGLPTETYEDLNGIIELLVWMRDLSKTKKRAPLNITCTISTYVPKAFTPFQWESQDSMIMFKQKINYLRSKVKEHNLKQVKLNCTDPEFALLECVMSRGDRRLCDVILDAYNSGAKFDAWGESLNIDNWITCGNKNKYDMQYEVSRKREIGESCPWDVLDSGLLKNFLIREAKKAYEVAETEACTENSCHACGVCFDLNVVNEVSQDLSKNNKYVKEIERNNKSIKSKESKDRSFAKTDSKKNNLPGETIQKVEIIHTKKGNLQFISHLDLQRLFERALRRANIPFAFSAGFNPRPKYNWLLPLPIFYKSDYEVMHLELYKKLNISDLHIILNEQLPIELKIKEIKELEKAEKLPLAEKATFSYKLLLKDNFLWEKYKCELKSNTESFLKKDSVLTKVQKKVKDQKNPSGKILREIDIRPCVIGIQIKNDGSNQIELAISGTTRPEVIINAISPNEFKLSPEDLQERWQEIWEVNKEFVLLK